MIIYQRTGRSGLSFILFILNQQTNSRVVNQSGQVRLETTETKKNRKLNVTVSKCQMEKFYRHRAHTLLLRNLILSSSSSFILKFFFVERIDLYINVDD